jgi:hypothetical protein
MTEFIGLRRPWLVRRIAARIDTGRPYAALISGPLFPLFALRPLRLIHVRPNNGGGRTMLDIIFIILGFGGILAMAAYAALCGRI